MIVRKFPSPIQGQVSDVNRASIYKPVIAWSAVTQQHELVLKKKSTAAKAATGVGKSGIGVSFGSTYPTFPSDPSYNVLGEITIIATIMPTSVSSDMAVISKTVTNGARTTPFDFGLNSAKGRIGRSNSTGYLVWASGSNLFSANETGVLAVTCGADMSVAPLFYKNGVKDTAAASNLYSGTGSGLAVGNTSAVMIGNRDDGAIGFSGLIHNAFVVPAVLVESEIKRLSAELLRLLAP